MGNKITCVLFKQDIELHGKKYKATYAYKLDLPQVDIDSLMRRGCIYADKDAKYYEEEKVVEKKVEVERPVDEKPVSKKKVRKNVANKDSKQAKVQKESTDKE